MRTQPEVIIQRLEADNSRLAKEAVLADAMEEGLDEFFHGCQMALDKLYTFGVKQVPIKDSDEGPQGLPWEAFLELCDQLAKRKLTGGAAKQAIELQMACATQEQWNDWYRRILIKDLRCGCSTSSVNKVAKKLKKPQYKVPIFECMLAHDSAKHEKKMVGEKLLQHKLDGVRALTIFDVQHRTVTLWTRNGRPIENFPHITKALEPMLDLFDRSMVLDSEIMSSDFQTLMKALGRKDAAVKSDAYLGVFDIIPLSEFKKGVGTMRQTARLKYFELNFQKAMEETGVAIWLPYELVNLDTEAGQARLKVYNDAALENGYEGIMLKDPNAVYECKRSASWLKMKPFIEVSLKIVAAEEGTGKNEGKLGAFVCDDVEEGQHIIVNVGSGFSDKQRAEYWNMPGQGVGMIAEVRADAVTQNQDTEDTFSLRFPRFKGFRGTVPGEKI